MSVTSIPMLLPISVYGGYFGAGVGVLLLGVLSVATGGDYRSANVGEEPDDGLNTPVASICFIASGAMSWPPTLVMMAGCLIGGLCGAQLGARHSAARHARSCGGRVGAALTVVFAWRYWF